MKTDHVIEFGKRPTAALTSIILALLASSVLAQAEDMRVGLAAPLSGTFAPLGNQLAEGARVAALFSMTVAMPKAARRPQSNL